MEIAFATAIGCVCLFWLIRKIYDLGKPALYSQEELLALIRHDRSVTGWYRRWLGPIEPPGQVVFMWREWRTDRGHIASALDVFLVRSNGKVQLLAVDVAEEVYGKLEEKQDDFAGDPQDYGPKGI